MKKLKIAMFMDTWYPDINGVIVVMDNLLNCMSEYADVTLVIPKMGDKVEDKRKYPFKVIRVNSMPVVLANYRLGLVDLEYLKLKRLFKKYDFDIVHIHSPFSLGRLGVRVARDKNIPVVATMHTRWEFEFKKYLKSDRIAKFACSKLIKTYNKCDSCIVLNKALMKVYKDYGYTGDMKLIYNGTDMHIVEDKNKAINRVNNLFRIDEDDKVFLFVGRIISIKNIFFTLDVMRDLKKRGMKFKMIYVGDGPDYDNLKKKVKEYKMTNEVILAGRIMDRELLKSIYYRADLFVFPSLFDASSLVQIEAASQETPTLFIEGSVTSDTVENNVTGFTEKEDVNLFANRIEEIFKNKSLYNKVKTNARKMLAKDWDTIAKETYDYYQELINDKK